jgi:hypothetical protein
MPAFVEGSVPSNICRVHQPALRSGCIHSECHYLCLFVCLFACLPVWVNIYKTAMFFCQENICFAGRNQKTTKNFCLTWRRILLELMRSVYVFITFNANKIHQGVRHFYELLNTWVHNICRTFLFVSFSLLCWINERWTDLVHPTESVCYLYLFCCSTVCVGWIADRIKWSSQNPPQINASPLFILIRTKRCSVD